jgi:2-keto-4-pentenoate hydratase
MTMPLTDLLLAQRANNTLIETLPAGLVPPDRATAYAIQDETVAALGPVGAWKVAPMPSDGVPFCAPILKRDVHHSGVELKRSGLAGLGIEVEIAVTLRSDLPPKAGGYQPGDIQAAIGSIHLAIEVLASRYRDRTAVPQLAGIADLQSNGAVVVGAAVSAEELPEFGEQALSLSFDGEVVQTSAGNASTDNVLRSLAWLADHAAERGTPLKAGDVVITGSRLGPTPFGGAVAAAEAPGLGSVSVRFI